MESKRILAVNQFPVVFNLTLFIYASMAIQTEESLTQVTDSEIKPGPLQLLVGTLFITG